MDFDIAIVGAGPIGSTLAYYLSSNKNLKICIIDKKRNIGYPLQCAGIVNKAIINFNEIPEELIINKVKGAYLHTDNNILKVQKEEDVAYVIDRVAYDQFLFKRAINKGVQFINQKVTDVDLDNGIITFANNEKISSKIVVGADGYKSVVSKSFGNAPETFNASQLLVKISDEAINSYRQANNEDFNDYVDTYVHQDIFPGFLWIIPTEDNLFRIGLFSNHDYKQQNQILDSFLENNFKNKDISVLEKYKGAIPIFSQNHKLVEKRGLLVGDAACEIKPTTGGGLILGFDACKIASDIIIKAINQNNIDLLNEYPKKFYKKYLKELKYQFKVQKTLNIFSNEDLDYFFIKLKENNCEQLISEYGDMDSQSILVKEIIKRGLLFKIIPSFFIKKVSRIFGF